jgi:hypothetical protein
MYIVWIYFYIFASEKRILTLNTKKDYANQQTEYSKGTAPYQGYYEAQGHDS